MVNEFVTCVMITYHPYTMYHRILWRNCTGFVTWVPYSEFVLLFYPFRRMSMTLKMNRRLMVVIFKGITKMPINRTKVPYQVP